MFRIFQSSSVVRLPSSRRISRGVVAISYLIEPFQNAGPQLSRGHTNWNECRILARIWQAAGFQVEIADRKDPRYRPPREAAVLIDIGVNLERWAPFLKPSCRKILHATGAHWLTQNRAELERLENLRDRRGAVLRPRRLATPSLATSHADDITCLGNAFTLESFAFCHKPTTRIPISSAYEFDFPGNKDWESARRRFLWLGSFGMVHKGLDLVLEAFAANPDLHLTICGRPEKEDDFFSTYERELTKLPNIRLAGWIDPGAAEFDVLRRDHGFAIYPSCCEGGGGSLIHCMHAGLVPVATREASVDLGRSGYEIGAGMVGAVVEAVRSCAAVAPAELRDRTEDTWNTVRMAHSVARFEEDYRNFVSGCLNDLPL